MWWRRSACTGAHQPRAGSRRRAVNPHDPPERSVSGVEDVVTDAEIDVRELSARGVTSSIAWPTASDLPYLELERFAPPSLSTSPCRISTAFRRSRWRARCPGDPFPVRALQHHRRGIRHSRPQNGPRLCAETNGCSCPRRRARTGLALDRRARLEAEKRLAEPASLESIFTSLPTCCGRSEFPRADHLCQPASVRPLWPYAEEFINKDLCIDVVHTTTCCGDCGWRRLVAEVIRDIEPPMRPDGTVAWIHARPPDQQCKRPSRASTAGARYLGCRPQGAPDPLGASAPARAVNARSYSSGTHALFAYSAHRDRPAEVSRWPGSWSWIGLEAAGRGDDRRTARAVCGNRRRLHRIRPVRDLLAPRC